MVLTGFTGEICILAQSAVARCTPLAKKNFPIKEISNLVSQPKVVKASFMRLAETYQDRNISSIAFPRFFEPNLFNDGAEIQKICNDFLSRLSIPTVVYTDYIPHSKTLIPLITKLVGVLSEEEKK